MQHGADESGRRSTRACSTARRCASRGRTATWMGCCARTNSMRRRTTGRCSKVLGGGRCRGARFSTASTLRGAASSISASGWGISTSSSGRRRAAATRRRSETPARKRLAAAAKRAVVAASRARSPSPGADEDRRLTPRSLYEGRLVARTTTMGEASGLEMASDGEVRAAMRLFEQFDSDGDGAAAARIRRHDPRNRQAQRPLAHLLGGAVALRRGGRRSERLRRRE